MSKQTTKTARTGDKVDVLVRRKITDCGSNGCGECDVCKRLELIEWSGQVGVANSIEQDRELDAYIKEKYGV